MENIGYVIWPKIEHSLCFSDDKLFSLLEEKIRSTDVDYQTAVMKMQQNILEAISRLKKRQIYRVRVGVSWAEASTLGGLQWIKWYLKKFSEAGFNILPCINYTPHNFAQARIEAIKSKAQNNAELQELAKTLKPMTNIPPEPLSAFGSFVEEFIKIAQDLDLNIEWIEAWNEPNIDSDWHPDERVATIKMFVDMLASASAVIHANGMKMLMGGLSGVKLEWLQKACEAGLLKHVDAIGLHGLRGTWSDKKIRPSWHDRIESLRSVMQKSGEPVPVWLTETGFSTIDFNFKIDRLELEQIQVAIFAEVLEVLEASDSPAAYWYSDTDLITDSIRFITTGWEDIIQYFFGDTSVAGRKKLLRQLLEEGGPKKVLEYAREHRLESLASTIIDRGDPSSWSEKDLKMVIEKYLQAEKES